MNLLDIIKRFRSRGLLLDSNLLLMLCIGSVDRKLVRKFKRTKAYSENDYDILCRFVGAFQKILTTPNILTEVNNLGRNLEEEHRNEFQGVFSRVTNILSEEYTESRAAVGIPVFRDCGLADSVTFCMSQSRNGCLLLTDDRQLAGKVRKSGGAALNFDNLRHIPPAD